jgi:CheY-like chemotaxis protein
MRILVADDSKPIRALLSALLEVSGHFDPHAVDPKLVPPSPAAIREPNHVSVPSEMLRTREEVAELTMSISVIAGRPAAERDEIRKQVLALASRYPIVDAAKGLVSLPMSTDVYAFRPSRS